MFYIYIDISIVLYIYICISIRSVGPKFYLDDGPIFSLGDDIRDSLLVASIDAELDDLMDILKSNSHLIVRYIFSSKWSIKYIMIYLEFLSKCLYSAVLQTFCVEIPSTEGMSEC